MRPTSALLFVLTAAAPFALAQTPTNLTAHPQESLDNGNGNLVPFGVSSSGSFASGRTMILVPANELPTVPSILTGIEVESQQTVALTYQTLMIHCAPTTATSLVGTFASNYTTAATMVLNGVNQTVNWQNNTWVPVTFTTPFVHDGVSSLLIEIQKELPVAATYPFATMSTSGSPARNDRPSMRYAFGVAGSNASQAATAAVSATALQFRLQWQATPTLRNRSDRGTSGNHYNVGGTVTLTLNGDANHLYVLAAGDAFLPAPVPAPGISGALLINNLVIFASGLVDPAGAATFVLNIPNNPALSGFYLVYQGAVIDPATVAITLTNGTDHFVNP